MAASLDDRFEVCGIIKPGPGTVSLSRTMKNEVDKLTKNDFLVLSSGSNDINKNDPRSAFRYIVDYMENVRHTNVILIGVPPRFDVEASDCPYLNNIIKHFNSKLRKQPHQMEESRGENFVQYKKNIEKNTQKSIILKTFKKMPSHSKIDILNICFIT
jgi:hypothetical protein